VEADSEFSEREDKVSDDELKVELERIHAKLDRILSIIDTKVATANRKAAEPRIKKEKQPPLTDVEIKQQQERFQGLFSRWMAGLELEVQNELESADAENLRRFADANNLNITTRTPKAKAMQLIAARFREKRQLMQGLVGNDERSR
jgi:hypothetical protein